MKSITSIGHHNEVADLIFTTDQKSDADSVMADLQALVTILRSDYSKAQGTIDTLQALLELVKVDYVKLSAENQFLKEAYEEDIGVYSATIHVPNTSAAVTSIQANTLRDFASVLNAEDEHEGRVHFALMARADQLEGKLEDEPGLRGVKP